MCTVITVSSIRRRNDRVCYTALEHVWRDMSASASRPTPRIEDLESRWDMSASTQVEEMQHVCIRESTYTEDWGLRTKNLGATCLQLHPWFDPHRGLRTKVRHVCIHESTHLKTQSGEKSNKCNMCGLHPWVDPQRKVFTSSNPGFPSLHDIGWSK